jgi:hypothetical protein
MTVGTDSQVTTTTTPTTHGSTTSPVAGTGFDGGNDYYTNTPSFGSMTNTSYRGYNITGLYWLANQFLYFSLDTTSIPDTDSTFYSIMIDGVEWLRSSMTYVASKNNATHWWIAQATQPFTVSGTDEIIIR